MGSPSQVGGESAFGEQLEDLFHFTQPNITLARGQRSYLTLFQSEADYTRKHVWTVDKPRPEFMYDWYYAMRSPTSEFERDVWDEIRFKNVSKQPLSTGVGVITRSGQLLGQTLLPYTPQGAEAAIRVNKALGILVDYQSQDLSDELEDATSGIRRLKRKATLTATNYKAENVALDIEKLVLGTVTESSQTYQKQEESLTKYGYFYGNAFRDPLAKLRWTIQLKPGETRTITYNYQVRHY